MKKNKAKIDERMHKRMVFEEIDLPDAKAKVGIGNEAMFQESSAAVEVVSIRPMMTRSLSSESSEILDQGIVDEKGYITFRVNINASKEEIFLIIEDYLDQYSSKCDNRFRTERIRALEIWTKRTRRESFADIAKDFGITLDTARKAFYKAYELIYGRKYNPSDYERPKIRKEYLRKNCETCPERESCSDLCPAVLAFVNQDTKPYQREKLSK